VPRQGPTELLHAAAGREVAEVDRKEAGGVEQLHDRSLRGRVVTGLGIWRVLGSHRL
jgi:hypothetical protein